MKVLFILAAIFLSFALNAQNILPDSLLKQNCTIILENKVINDVQIWTSTSNKTEYSDGKSLHDVNTSEIKRFDFKDYSAILKNNTLNKIRIYDLMVAANTYQGIKNVDENDKITFSRKNNSAVKTYPSYTKFIDGNNVYDVDKKDSSNYSASVKTDSAIANSEILPKEPDAVKTSVDSDKKDEAAVIKQTTVQSSNVNENYQLDAITSYRMGQEAAKKTFDEKGYTAMSCLATGCTGGFLSSGILLIKPDKIKPGVMPYNVNQQMFEEGYYNKVHELRRRNYFKGSLICISTIAATYVVTYMIVLISII